MDLNLRELEREISVDGWSPENMERWISIKDKLIPECPPRKSLKPDVYKRDCIFKDGWPLLNQNRYWHESSLPKDQTYVPNTEFNDVLVFERLKKINTGRTAALFTSTKYKCTLHMDIQNFSKAANSMMRGILKGRFVWKIYRGPHKQLITFLEE